MTGPFDQAVEAMVPQPQPEVTEEEPFDLWAVLDEVLKEFPGGNPSP